MYIYSNEIVFRGHPDKVCDQISDKLLDAYLEQDKNSRCAIETMGGKGKIFITGEVTSSATVDVESVVKEALKDVGYDTDYEIINNLGQQSPDIAQGVDTGGAGDQGMMFGYACRETPQFLPKAMVILQELSRFYDMLCHVDKRFLPDGKAQITGIYNNDKQLIGIKDFTISYQNTEKEREKTDAILKDYAIDLCRSHGIMSIDKFHINPTGKFLIGGFEGDSGLTGRKIVVDSYHSFAPVGGGAMCVDKDTEYLSPDGWKKISEYDGGMVGQWDDWQLSFVKPSAYHVNPAEHMMHITSPQQLDMVLSDHHDVVLLTSKGNLIKKAAKDIFDENGLKNGNYGQIPISFIYDDDNEGLPFSEDQIRLQCAFCADGSILNKSLYDGRVRVKRERKKERMRYLLDSCCQNWRESTDGEYSIFWFTPPVKEKHLSVALAGANAAQLRIIADEVQFWDGEDYIFRTTIKDDADFIQIAFMKSYGTNASIHVDNRIGERYGDNNRYERKSILYEVCVKKCKTCEIKHGKAAAHCDVKTFTPSDGTMYCFTVPSGKLVLRRNNHVFVTGNCGKDGTKVDRSGAYKARQIAIRYLVSNPDIEWCEVQLSYAIGLDKPLAIYIKTDKGIIENGLDALYEECTPRRIIEDLKLRDVKYYETAQFGHFGNSSFPWEVCY